MAMIENMAWRNLRKQKRRTALTAAAMTLAVALSMIMLSWIDGIYGNIKEQIIDRAIGFVQVHHSNYIAERNMYDSIQDADAVVERIEAIEGVRTVSYRLFGAGLVGSDNYTEGAQLLGVNPARESQLRGLDTRVEAGTYFTGKEPNEVILGVELARKLEAAPEDTLVIMTQGADGSMANDLYTVVGTVKTGDAMIDRGGLLMDIADLQTLLVLPDQVHEIVVVGTDRSDEGVTALSEQVDKAVDGEDDEVLTWWEANPTAAGLFQFQDISGAFVAIFFFGAAAAGVINAMLMSVFERTREFGVLRAIGLGRASLVRLVLAEATMIAILSSIAGVTLGAIGTWYLVEFGIAWDADMTFAGATPDDALKAKWSADSILTPVVGVFCFSILAALWPALRAARLDPLEAIRE